MFPSEPPLPFFSIAEQVACHMYGPRTLILCFTFCNGCLDRMVHTIRSNVVKTNYLLLLHLSGYVVSFYSPSGSGGNSQVVVMLVKLHHCRTKDFAMKIMVCACM